MLDITEGTMTEKEVIARAKENIARLAIYIEKLESKEEVSQKAILLSSKIAESLYKEILILQTFTLEEAL